MLDITELEPKIANAAKLMEMLSQPAPASAVHFVRRRAKRS